MIFYFTATGNSLYAAQTIAHAIGDTDLRSIPHEMRAGRLCYADQRIGIVAPIFCHELPAMVHGFLTSATFDTDYLFAVLTYGNRHSCAIEHLCAVAERAGHDIAYAATLLMVDNWLPGYDVAQQLAMDKHIDENLARIAGDIAQGKRCIEPVTEKDRADHQRFLQRGGFVFTPHRAQDLLSVNAACVGCGTCAQVCPAGCIALRDGTAQRDALAGLGCNACLACIHACPHAAVDISMGDLNPSARFRNQHVTLDQIILANSR